MAGAFLDHLNLRAGALHEFLRFEPDVLIPQMARYLVGDSSGLLLKVGGQHALPLQLHEIFTDIERPFRHAPHLISSDDLGIFPFPHQAATGHRRDDIVAFLHPGQKRRDIRRGGLLNRRRIADVEGGHAAAALFGDHDMHTIFFEDLNRRLADVGRLIIDQAAAKERNFPRRGAQGPVPPLGAPTSGETSPEKIARPADPDVRRPTIPSSRE